MLLSQWPAIYAYFKIDIFHRDGEDKEGLQWRKLGLPFSSPSIHPSGSTFKYQYHTRYIFSIQFPRILFPPRLSFALPSPATASPSHSTFPHAVTGGATHVLSHPCCVWQALQLQTSCFHILMLMFALFKIRPSAISFSPLTHLQTQPSTRWSLQLILLSVVFHHKYAVEVTSELTPGNRQGKCKHWTLRYPLPKNSHD